MAKMIVMKSCTQCQFSLPLQNGVFCRFLNTTYMSLNINNEISPDCPLPDVKD